MNTHGQFIGISQRLKRNRNRAFGTVGAAVQKYLRQIRPSLKNAEAARMFMELLPAALAADCEVDSIHAGIMQVRVQPGPVMFQMRTLSAALLEELRMRCPRAAIREIKVLSRR